MEPTAVCGHCGRGFFHGYSGGGYSANGDTRDRDCSECGIPTCEDSSCGTSWWTAIDLLRKLCVKCMDRQGIPRDAIEFQHGPDRFLKRRKQEGAEAAFVSRPEVQDLLDILSSSAPVEERTSAVEALSRQGPAAAGVLPRLVAAARNGEDELVAPVLEALEALHAPARNMVPLLGDLLTDPRPARRLAATRALAPLTAREKRAGWDRVPVEPLFLLPASDLDPEVRDGYLKWLDPVKSDVPAGLVPLLDLMQGASGELFTILGEIVRSVPPGAARPDRILINLMTHPREEIAAEVESFLGDRGLFLEERLSQLRRVSQTRMLAILRRLEGSRISAREIVTSLQALRPAPAAQAPPVQAAIEAVLRGLGAGDGNDRPLRVREASEGRSEAISSLLGEGDAAGLLESLRTCKESFQDRSFTMLSRSLSRLGEMGRPLVPELLALVPSLPPPRAFQVLETIQSLLHAGARVEDGVVALVRDSRHNRAVRTQACQCLLKLGHRGLEVLGTLLREDDPVIQRIAIQTLVKLSPKQATAGLRSGLEHVMQGKEFGLRQLAKDTRRRLFPGAG